MKPRNMITAGVLFSAMAFTGATWAQSGTTATPPGSDRASSAQSTTTQPPSASGSTDNSSSSSMNTSSNRSGSASGDTSSRATGATDHGANGSQASTSVDSVTQPHAMRASKIIGKNVENANGDRIGEIKDMVVDMQNERVRYVVLSHGGMLGIGDKLFAYPMSMVTTEGTNRDKLVMNVNKEQLDKAPGFEKNKWPDFADSSYTGRIDEYYGAQSRRDGEKAARIVRASDLIGKNFDDANGKSAGEVEDLVVDSSTGNVEYAIVDFDDSWAKNTDGKLVAIPLNEMMLGGDRHDKLVIQMSPDRIDMSHAFASNQWPDFSDPAWAQNRGNTAQGNGSAAPTSQRENGSPRS